MKLIKIYNIINNKKIVIFNHQNYQFPQIQQQKIQLNRISQQNPNQLLYFYKQTIQTNHFIILKTFIYQFLQFMYINIIYSTQTGTSQDVAQQLAFNIQNLNHNPIIYSADQITLTHLKQMQICYFLISTTGQGQPPDSLKELWNELLQKNLHKQYLSKLKFSVFGFGDSKYGQHFNSMARKLYRRLLMLGAIQIVERGLGDYQDKNGYRAQYNVWKKNIIEYTQKLQPTNVKIQQKDRKKKKFYNFKLKQLNYLCENEFQRTTYEAIFETNLQYSPGNIISLYPQNGQAVVDKFLNYFELDRKSIIKMSKLDIQSEQLEAYNLFKKYLNISEFVPFLLFEQLYQFTQNQLFKSRLKQMAENYSDYSQYIIQYKRNFLEVVNDFHLKVPFSYFIKRINFIKPRKYSIASYRQGQVGIIVRLVQKEINKNRIIKGLLSNDLINNISKGQIRRGYITEGKFNYQKNKKYLFVGIGTGVSPFFSYIQARQRSDHQNSIYLIFGNRNSKELYKLNYLEKVVEQKKMILNTATSRQGNKKYVQDVIKEQKQSIKRFVDNQTYIYICGPYSTFADFIIKLLADILEFNEQQIKIRKKNKKIASQCW